MVMALEVEWYDLVCLVIIGAALVGALWVLWVNEGVSKNEFGILEVVNVVPRGRGAMGHVCWRGVHPLWLLATRFLSFLIMAVLLSLDVLEYDANIFMYYTDEGYRYWLRWQVPLCALVLIISVTIAFMHIVKIKVQPLCLNHLCFSCWPKLNPLWLFFYRSFAFLCLAHIHFDIIALDGLFSFYFYTQWTFTLVMMYFALGTVVSAYGCWQVLKKPPLENGEMAELLRRDLEESTSTNSMAYKDREAKRSIKFQSQYIEEGFKQGAGFWGYLMQITYQMSAGAVILTDIVFWCVIVPFLSISHFKLNLLMGCMHTLNAVFLLLETALNNLPFPWFRVAYFVLWSCGYIIFQWVIHACGFTWWPYPFLKLNSPWSPLWYFLLAIIHIPCYGMYSLIVKAKITILPRLFPGAF